MNFFQTLLTDSWEFTRLSDGFQLQNKYLRDIKNINVLIIMDFL